MRVGVVLASLLGATLVCSVARADDEAAKRDASVALTQGNQLAKDGNYAGALALFRAAYARYPSVKLLLNIGTTLRQLGRNAEAADTYERYLRDPAADPGRKAEVEALLATLDALVGKLRVVVDVDAATVRVDGTVVGTPAKSVVVRVEPGKHTVSAQREGAPPVQVDVQAVAGREVPVPVRLAPVSPPSPPAEPPAPAPAAPAPPPAAPAPPPAAQVPDAGPPPRRRSSAHLAAATTTTVVGAAGLIAGTALALTAKSQWNELLSGCASRSPSPMSCRPSDAHLQDSAGRLADGATAAFIIGGSAMTAATVLWITVPRPPRAVSAWQVSPLVGGHGAGAILERKF